jgi:hypothetical protein
MPMVKEKIDTERNPPLASGCSKDEAQCAVLVESISRFELEADGKHLAVHSERAVLTFHYSVFRELLAVLPAAVLQSERLLHKTPHVNFAMGCEGWELGAIDNGNSLVLTFRLQGGANVAFCLPREQIPPMVDALISAAQLVPVQPYMNGPLQ